MGTQISAHIADETRRQMEAFVQRHGVTKARLIEDALQHHLLALREIPQDLVIPGRLVVTEASLADIADALAADTPPTPALRELMAEDA
jgi:predicted RecB family nuclease